MRFTRFFLRRRAPFSKRSSLFFRVTVLLFLLLLFAAPGKYLFIYKRLHLPFMPHFSKSCVKLVPGEKYTLEIRGIKLNKKVTYSSSNSIVASVTPTGVVHAWKRGRTVIQACFQDKSKKTIRCLIKVTGP